MAWPEGASPRKLAAHTNLAAVPFLAAAAIIPTGTLDLAPLAAIQVFVMAQLAVSTAMFLMFFRLQQIGGLTTEPDRLRRRRRRRAHRRGLARRNLSGRCVGGARPREKATTSRRVGASGLRGFPFVPSGRPRFSGRPETCAEHHRLSAASAVLKISSPVGARPRPESNSRAFNTRSRPPSSRSRSSRSPRRLPPILATSSPARSLRGAAGWA